MIKAIAKTSSGDALILGITGENMARLMSNEPIAVDLADMGPDADNIAHVWIIGGKDNDALVDQLRAQAERLGSPLMDHVLRGQVALSNASDDNKENPR